MKTAHCFFGIAFSMLLVQGVAVAQNDCFEVKSFDISGANNAWIEYGGMTVHTQDGGDSWSSSPLNGHWYKQHLDFINSEVGWVVRDHTISKTSNGGDDWEVQFDYNPIPAGPGIPFAVDKDVAYVVSDRELVRTTDGGLNWEIIDMGMELTATWFFNAEQGIVAGEGGTCILKRTNDGGKTWENQTVGGIHEIYNLGFISELEGYFILAQEPGLHRTGPLYMTDDGLHSWEIILHDVASYSVTASGTIYALVNDYSSIRIMKKESGQDEWQEILGDLSGMRIVKFLDQNQGWVVGDHMVLRTTDGGEHWEDLTPETAMIDCTPPGIFVADIQYDSDRIEVMSTEDGFLYIVPQYSGWGIDDIKASAIETAEVEANEVHTFSSPGLETGMYWIYAVDEWGNISDPREFSFAVYGEIGNYIAKSFDIGDKDNAWIEGSNVFIRTEDGGETWSYTPVVGNWHKQHIDFLNSEVGWVVRDHSVSKTSSGGDEWVVQRVYSEIPYGPGIPFAVNEDVLYVVSDRGLLNTKDGGNSWDYIDLSMELTAAWFFDVDRGMVAGESDGYVCTIKRTSDGGSNWDTQIVEGIHEIYNLEFISEKDGFFILAQEPGLYSTGPLYKTSDAMESWDIILHNVASYSVTGNGTIYAMVNDESTIRVMKKAGGLNEWVEVLDSLSDMRIVKFLDESLGWVVGDNQILKTMDGGATWVDQTANITVRDSIPPVLSLTSLDESSAVIEAISSESGTIYLTPENTEKNLLQIRASAFVAIEAHANRTCTIPFPTGETQDTWLYAMDWAGNISEPVPFEAVSVREQTPADHFRLYPNPTAGHFTIEVGETEPVSVDVISMNGQFVQTTILDGGSNEIDISALNNGVYLIRVRTVNFVETAKLVKH